ncbi:hypothetical protein GH714_011522 [Hevea brasiliensis]|uniref:B-like cyclin n=1 Tax=Hevea brasiliensis TaxID=3981 RepID=A0A6A6NGJ4_HEVBR|nr:hypothetical protein GH714_011522 [Hevea brasiliensis]
MNMEGESISELLCQESENCLVEDVVDEDTFVDLARSREEEEGYVEMLVEREINFRFKGDQPMGFDNWLRCARLEAIAWILKTRAIFDFRFQTAYLSLAYFDRFLSKRSIDSEKLWAVRLLAVACLSLAAKMEEIKAPALSEFQIEDYNFKTQVIQRMELLVLNTLEWRMISITPFAFLHYLIIKFCKDSPPRQIISRIVGFISTLMREINLMDHRPSVIAAAATLMALDQSLTRRALECKINSTYSEFLEIIVASIVVLFVSRNEHPRAPLFAWIVGYASGCLATLPLLYWRYRHRNQVLEQESAQRRQGSTHISVLAGPYSVSVSRSSEADDRRTAASTTKLQHSYRDPR